MYLNLVRAKSQLLASHTHTYRLLFIFFSLFCIFVNEVRVRARATNFKERQLESEDGKSPLIHGSLAQRRRRREIAPN